MMIKLKKILKELADEVYYQGRTLDFAYSDAVSFVYFKKNGDILLSNKRESHGDFRDYEKMQDYFEKYIKKSPILYDRGEFTTHFIEGRFWVKHKIISFWQYPKKEVFFKIIEKIKQNRYDIDNSWKVEVYKYVGSDDIEHMNAEKEWGDIDSGMLVSEIIPINKYK